MDFEIEKLIPLICIIILLVGFSGTLYLVVIDGIERQVKDQTKLIFCDCHNMKYEQGQCFKIEDGIIIERWYIKEIDGEYYLEREE